MPRLLYTLFLYLLLPFIPLRLLWRARKQPAYLNHVGERFGRYPQRLPGAVWVHAVSLGEMRSAVPLIRALLDRGETVVCTHFTPAGRRESTRVFGPDIAAGRLAAVWVPFELAWCFRGFFRAFRPKLGLVMEVEIWPRMVFAARDAGVPLFMCNAGYPSKSVTRDARLPLRPAGAFYGQTLPTGAPAPATRNRTVPHPDRHHRRRDRPRGGRGEDPEATVAAFLDYRGVTAAAIEAMGAAGLQIRDLGRPRRSPRAPCRAPRSSTHDKGWTRVRAPRQAPRK